MSRGGLLRRFPVLGFRDFRLLLADRLIAPASVGFSIVGVSFAVLKATDSAADLSYVLAAQIAPSLVFALIGGVAADRFPPQRVIVAANLLMALGEGTFGMLVLTSRPPLWAMIGLEAHHRDRGRDFLSRLPGAAPPPRPARPAAGGERDQPAGDEHRPDGRRGRGRPAGGGGGRRLGAVAMRHRHGDHGSAAAVHPRLAARCGPGERRRPIRRRRRRSMLTELREGWSEFRSHTWLWVIVAQFCVVMMAWYGAFSVLGPVVARQHLGGPAAWGAITAADAFGLIAGGLAVAAVHPSPAHAVRRAHRRRGRHIPALAGDGPAAGSCVRRIVRPRRVRRDDDGAVDRHDGAEHPVGQAGPGLLLRRPRLGHGDACRSPDRRPAGYRDRDLPGAVRGGSGDHPRVRAGPHPS